MSARRDASTEATFTCPLCDATGPRGKVRTLYGTRVCTRCAKRFANLRQLAFVLDVLAASLLREGFLVFSVFFLAGRPHGTEHLVSAIFLLLFLIKDGWNGQSPGKRFFGLRAVRCEDLRPIDVRSSFRRNLPMLIPFVQIVAAFRLVRGVRIGDRWAHSRVIWMRYADHPIFMGQAACWECGFDLTANTSGVCPECGTPVPPTTSS